LRVSSLQRLNLRLFAAFLLAVTGLLAQDPTASLTPGVARVGARLSCRCGACRNTIATCPMLHCESSGPMRARIKQMQDQGKSDNAIVNTIVQEQGIVALAAPPAEGWGLFTWVMPGVALLFGFLVYSWWVRRNTRQQTAPPLTEVDRAVLDRFRDQIDPEFDDSADFSKGAPHEKK
jgi:cytochrome c-type biogenesis protein CcmH/NrfF